MVWPRCSSPGWAEIGKLALEPFALEPQRAAAGEAQRDDSARRIGFGELDGQKIEHRVAFRRIERLALARQHPLEAQRGAAALELWAVGMLPIEAIERDHHPVLLRTPQDVRSFHH